MMGDETSLDASVPILEQRFFKLLLRLRSLKAMRVSASRIFGTRGHHDFQHTLDSGVRI